MREITFDGRKPNESQQEVLRKKFVASRTTPIDDSELVDYGSDFGWEDVKIPVTPRIYQGEEYLVAMNNENDFTAEQEFVFEVAKEVVDNFFNIIISEFKKAEVHKSESELLENFISKDELMKRLVFNFSKLKGGLRGKYDTESHRLWIKCNDFFDKNGKFRIRDFINTLTHELTHLVSYSAVDYKKVLNKEGYEMKQNTSGYVVTENEKEGDHRFNGFNEAVISKYGYEIAGQIIGSIGIDSSDPRFKIDKKEEAKTYELERTKFELVLKYFSEFLGVSVDGLWLAMKRGVLEGRKLNDPKISAGLDECFGKGFVKNYLEKFEESDPEYIIDLRTTSIEEISSAIHFGPIHKRWEENGKKILKNCMTNRLTVLRDKILNLLSK